MFEPFDKSIYSLGLVSLLASIDDGNFSDRVCLRVSLYGDILPIDLLEKVMQMCGLGLEVVGVRSAYPFVFSGEGYHIAYLVIVRI